MVELIIIKYLLNIDNYNKYRYYIKIKDNKELNKLYTILDSMMSSYNRTILFSEYKAVVLQEDSSLDFLISNLEEENIGEDVLNGLVQTAVERSWAHDHALLSIDVSEGRKPLHNVIEHLSALEDNSSVEETKYVTDDLEEIYNETVGIPGLRWRLNSLNKSLGSLRKGDFGFVFARPETGKTTFLTSEVSFFAEQVGEPILWFNNEESHKKVKSRLYQASLGLPLASLFSDKKGNVERYKLRTKNLILMPEEESFNKRQIERICKEVNPSLILFDQIDKLYGFPDDREDLRLGNIYIWARELAKKYCPVIGVCQSDGTGEGVKWLTMNNVANAKTSKQAEADWILGIGATHIEGMEHVRYLNISKNKLSGDEDTDPNMRHGKIECTIQPEIARYKDF